jgi:hypothetical protein
MYYKMLNNNDIPFNLTQGDHNIEPTISTPHHKAGKPNWATVYFGQIFGGILHKIIWTTCHRETQAYPYYLPA